MEDGAGIPEDLRCKRSDGKQWRCNALSMPDKTVCEKHYIQAKKRAANSAMRASIKKARRMPDSTDPEVSRSSASPLSDAAQFSGSPSGKKHRGRLVAASAAAGEESRVKYGYNVSPLSKEVKGFVESGNGEHSGKSSDSSGEAGRLACHQCGRSDGTNVVWCSGCCRRGYCDSCISRWYTDIPLEEIRSSCPACQSICSCRVCRPGDNLIKIRVQEIGCLDKLRYLHRLLSFVLPVLKQIYSEQCFELGVEAQVFGIKGDIPRAKINSDEQMCCDFCRVPIFDYHRHCTSCSSDLCLTCYRDLRRASAIAARGELAEHKVDVKSQENATAATVSETSEKPNDNKSCLHSAEENVIDFSKLFPQWKANSDGSIFCGPVEAGGCGSSKLILRRILKINWVAKLVKNVEEMVNGCKVPGWNSFSKCICTRSATSQSSESKEWRLSNCYHTNDISHKLLYSPLAEELKHEGIDHFLQHWTKGEPIIVKHAFDRSLASNWDPFSIWRSIQETEVGRTEEENISVKAIDCLSQSEVDIELTQFLRGYVEGIQHENGLLQMLKLKDWPPPSAVEELILCHRTEFLGSLPLLEFIHSKWGVLNLVAKLPQHCVQTEHGPKMFIAYGMQEQLGRGDVLYNLQINMSDLVYLLMNSSEMNIQVWKQSKNDTTGKCWMETDAKETLHNGQLVDSDLKLNEQVHSPDVLSKKHDNLTEDTCMEDLGQVGNGIVPLGNGGLDSSLSHEDRHVAGKVCAGAIWDVFCREDVPKLNEYLRVHRRELSSSATQQVVSGLHPVYDQAFFLDREHKRKLKDEFGVEPWTFEQHVGEAVFIPAGCSFQVRNIQSSVQLALDFLSPESLGESVRLAQEIRCLPNDHDAKLKMLEVGKISLYAASSAIREIQKITLDPELGQEIKFDDPNLTSMVAENLEKLMKQGQILCP